jgi:hypothetical protein
MSKQTDKPMSDTSCRAACRAVVSISDDEDVFTLRIELPVDDRSITLNYPKSKSSGFGGPYVYLNTGCNGGEFREEEISCEEFEDWTKVAVGLMPRKRERRWLCQICGDKEGFGPILRDDVWAAIAPNPRGLMCWPCMKAKAKAKECLGRKLTRNDIVMPYGNKLEGLSGG